MPHRPYASEPIYIGPETPHPGYTHRRRSNGWGIAGFIVSLLSLLFTLGLLCPLGLLISLIGMLRAPRGLAFAGVLLGALGTLPWAALAVGVYSEARHQEQIARHQVEKQQTVTTFEEVLAKVHAYRADEGHLPDQLEGNRIAVRFEDGWEQSIRYEIRGDKILLRSAGPDGEFETGDDMQRVIPAGQAELDRISNETSSESSTEVDIR